MAEFEKVVKAQIASGKPDASKFDLVAAFGKGAELEKNAPQAVVVIVREILHSAFTMEKCLASVKAAKGVFEKVLADADLEPEELLYAGARVIANEMRSPETKTLPVYKADTSVSETFFDAVYSAELCSEEQMLKWLDDMDDETPGRQDVIMHVNAFFDWLKYEPESEEEDEEDEDDD